MDKLQQTKKSFSDKWANTPKLLFDIQDMRNSGVLQWILTRNGFRTEEDFANFLKGKRRILDAGCGNGRVSKLMSTLTKNKITAIDFNISAAENNLKRILNIEVVEADLMNSLSHLQKYDFIYCQEVLHHTSEPKKAFYNLVQILEQGGHIATYVYKEKSPVREFTDDFIREKVSSLSYEDSLKIAESLAILGKSLSELEEQITVPDIPVLGIKEGTYPLHSFVYNFFLKCWFNKSLDLEQSTAINLDWFHPELCSRYKIDEVKEWFLGCNLDIIHELEDDYGITIHGLKN
jgi:SAM-dependent methyltransferase